MAKFSLTAAHIATLTAINAATVAGNNFHITAADGQDLAKNGFIEINPNLKDDAGNPAARLTDAGKAALPADATKPAGEAKVSFFIAPVAPIPSITRRGGGGAEPKYPLKDIPLGGAIFIPAEPGRDAESTSKAFGSMVSSFNKSNPDKYLTSRAVADGYEAGFRPQGNEEQYKGVKGTGIYHRPLEEKPVRAPRKPKTETAEAAE
jgi:hypothetical protein